MSVFDTLLEVQERDTAADQLRHRRAHLPARSRLAGLEDRLSALQGRLDGARARREDVATRQARLEEEVGFLDRRIAEIDKRMYSGTVSAPRELQAMAAEVESLKRRRSLVEEEILVLMEEGDSVASEMAVLGEERSELDAEAAELRASLTEDEVAIDAEISSQEQQRASAAQSVPADLLSTYEGLRAKLGGIGAARLVGSSCSGCHLTLPAAELARIKREPPDALVLCEQCGRILVR